MGILDKIKGAIFGTHAKAATPAPGGSTPTPPASTPASVPPVAARVPPAAAPASPTAAPAPSGGTASSVPPVAAQPQAAPSASSATTAVDVSEVLDRAVKSKNEKLDWRHSIVDLMKALDLDSSLASRKELAEELHYTGDTSDSATMNMWLHKALMKKLAENGGKVPAELSD